MKKSVDNTCPLDTASMDAIHKILSFCTEKDVISFNQTVNKCLVYTNITKLHTHK